MVRVGNILSEAKDRKIFLFAHAHLKGRRRTTAPRYRHVEPISTDNVVAGKPANRTARRGVSLSFFFLLLSAVSLHEPSDAVTSKWDRKEHTPRHAYKCGVPMAELDEEICILGCWKGRKGRVPRKPKEEKIQFVGLGRRGGRIEIDEAVISLMGAAPTTFGSRPGPQRWKAHLPTNPCSPL
ncbi:hypothetical protein SISNIDRAFT_183624 [Sistotremastrum niveocremeum HHB9708]|uniref:Uncharacterized protein n=1 Tax=Sistotremastrum niveocremeum HHB9708 TaxID=1314777 RepID=A0A164R3U2_9AGAM|nr:hypothetical protein SISNIDRAFT_183624 [Sistotremastrum niveocremeum HHB9708]